MLALMGEVRLNPMVTQHWLHTNPKTAAPAKRNTSLRGTCSLRVKGDVSQNNAAPPATLNDTIVMPSMPWLMASLPKGAINPQNKQARNMDAWACKGGAPRLLLGGWPMFCCALSCITLCVSSQGEVDELSPMCALSISSFSFYGAKVLKIRIKCVHL